MSEAAQDNVQDSIAVSSKPKGGFFSNMKIRTKLIVFLMLFGLVPSIVMFVLLEVQSGPFHRFMVEKNVVSAVKLIETIERNLFERYGDVQAFALNTAATDKQNWKKPTEDNPLINAMNGYMTGYGIYDLMVIVNPKGEVLAVNSVGPKGQKVPTNQVYSQSFADAAWLKNVLAGKFTDGTNGLSGTVVEDAHRHPLIDKIYGKESYVLTYAAPVKDASGNVVAVWANFADFGLVEDIAASFYKDFAKAGQKETEITILDKQGRIMVDYDPHAKGWKTYKRNFKVIGKINLAKLGVQAAQEAIKKDAQGSVVYSWHARKKIEQAAGYAHSVGAYDYPGLGWSALVRTPADVAYAVWDFLELEMMIAMAVTVVLILILGTIIGNSFSRPITGMSSSMNELAHGNLETEVPSKDRGDEIGEMAQAVQVFKDNAIERERLEAEQKQSQERRERRAQKIESLNSEFESSVATVLDTVASASTEMRSTAEAMSSTANETSSQATTVAAAAEEATSNVQTVSAAAEQLSSAITEISGQVAKSTQITSEAVHEAESTNQEIQGLAEAANKIGEVVALITDIAEQTNLLALNATIEAARAGDAGKGFAVVASEVKNLANQTAKATEDISEQVGGIQNATQKAVGAIQGISKTINEVNEIASAIAAAVEEQGAATQEIARNVEQAAEGTQDVTVNITKVTEGAGETGQASGQVLSSAEQLSKQAENLREHVRKYLEDVKSA